MARFFTLAQAQAVLPDVEVSMRDAILLKSQFQEAESELQQANQRIAVMGGSLVNRDRLLAQKNRREKSASRLKEALDRIQSYGCQVKDLDIGLIDFPTLYRGEEVLLCWKVGEEGISFWHGLTEGFQGRKKIDREFLENHTGDLTH